MSIVIISGLIVMVTLIGNISQNIPS